MLKHFATTKSAKITLMLIGWVFAICLSQNAGWQSVCEFKYSALADLAHISKSPSDIGEQCDLTEKLLSSAQVNLEHVVISIFVVALIVVAWFVLTRSATPQFTEPIVPRRRLHLTFCVFRE
ncbi:hypothetical protein ELS82_17395 [Vibrio ouci]|uniref:Copper resistance protein n=2 Tax=Vibrio ouci TaxID=2499078 RepID=A0A4Y8WC00_9VIBR|nr:hypothetical protein ELS82_17395 [Vibrio ouci]